MEDETTRQLKTEHQKYLDNGGQLDFQSWCKINRNTPNSGENDYWTPRPIFEALNKRFGPFTLDVAASEKNKLVENYFDKETNALKQMWSGRAYCNPPYLWNKKKEGGDGTRIQDWVEKGFSSVESGDAEVVVLLIPVYTIKNYFWHDTVFPNASHLVIFRACLDFSGPFSRKGGASRSGSIVIVFSKMWSGRGLQLLRMSNKGEWLSEECYNRDTFQLELKNGVVAKGNYLEESQFVVHEGSTAALNITPSWRESDQVWRMKLILEGALTVDGEYLRFTRDVTFNSPSAAASVVRATQSNGRKLWKLTA
jgi:phage N-6-adenine-methyltransferase